MEKGGKREREGTILVKRIGMAKKESERERHASGHAF